MGLDIVEFGMAIEDAFEVGVPDSIAATLITPRHVIELLNDRLGNAPLRTSPLLNAPSIARVRRSPQPTAAAT